MKISGIKDFIIGGLNTGPNLVLAPMSGVTNSAFRRLLREENGDALGLVVTEFISIEAISRRVPRSLEMMKFEPMERPISIQIFGYDIDRMVDSAKLVEEMGADIIDINCGCPVPKVVRRGGGCELMRQVDHLGEILNSVSKAVSIPLTLKIRSGWSDKSINALEVAKVAVEAGVKMLAIHGRTREQLYRGKADWSIVDQVAKEISIPVVGSGDILDGESAVEALKLSISGLMIGRGAMENPWIFKDIQEYIRTGEVVSRPFTEIPRVLLRYLDLLLETMPPKGAIGKMKQIISQCTKRVPNGSDIRRSLCTEVSLDTIKSKLESWRLDLDRNPSWIQGRGSNSLLTTNPYTHAGI